MTYPLSTEFDRRSGRNSHNGVADGNLARHRVAGCASLGRRLLSVDGAVGVRARDDDCGDGFWISLLSRWVDHFGSIDGVCMPRYLRRLSTFRIE